MHAPHHQQQASLSKDWQDEVRRGDRRNPLFRPFSSAAMAEPPKPEASELFIGSACSAEAKADDTCPGVHMSLQTDATARRDFHQIRAASHEHVREFRSVLDISGDVTKAVAVPMDRLAGKTLYLVISDALGLGGIDGLRLIGPRYVALQLQ